MLLATVRSVSYFLDGSARWGLPGQADKVRSIRPGSGPDTSLLAAGPLTDAIGRQPRSPVPIDRQSSAGRPCSQQGGNLAVGQRPPQRPCQGARPERIGTPDVGMQPRSTSGATTPHHQAALTTTFGIRPGDSCQLGLWRPAAAADAGPLGSYASAPCSSASSALSASLALSASSASSTLSAGDSSTSA